MMLQWNTDPDRPKRGLARIAELIGRDFGAYWGAGIVAVLAALPLAGCLFLLLDTGALVFAAAGCFSGALLGPALAALYDTILRTLRDEACYWRHTYARAFWRNARIAVLPGMAAAGFWCFVLCAARLAAQSPSAPLLLCLLGCLLFTALLTLYWMQLVLLELPAPTLLRNAFLLLMGSLPRAAAAAAVQLAYGAAVILLPGGGFLFLLCGPWLPVLLAALLLQKPLEEGFDLNRRIRAIQEERRSTFSEH